MDKETSEKKERPEFDCRSCPIAKAFGLCEYMCSFLQKVDSKEFLIHMASARKEILLGINSLVEEAIRLEEERIEKRKSAPDKAKDKGESKLRRISID